MSHSPHRETAAQAAADSAAAWLVISPAEQTGRKNTESE